MSLRTRSLTPKPVRRGMFSDLVSPRSPALQSPVKLSRPSTSPRGSVNSIELCIGADKGSQTDASELYRIQDSELLRLRSEVRQLTQRSVNSARLEREHLNCSSAQKKLNTEIKRLQAAFEDSKLKTAGKRKEKMMLLQGHRELAQEFKRHQSLHENVVRVFKDLIGSLLEACESVLTQTQRDNAVEAMRKIEAAGVNMQAEAHRVMQAEQLRKRSLTPSRVFKFDDESIEQQLQPCDSVTEIQSIIECMTATTPTPPAIDALIKPKLPADPLYVKSLAVSSPASLIESPSMQSLPTTPQEPLSTSAHKPPSPKSVLPTFSKAASRPSKPDQSSKPPSKSQSPLGVVLFDYTSNSPDELSAARGDILAITDDKDGWVTASSETQSGRFPSKLLHML